MPAEVTVENAPPKLRDLFNKGFVAMERGNLEYAIDMFLHCIEDEPYFFTARRFLRAAEIKVYKSSKHGGLSAITGLLGAAPGLITAQLQARSGKMMQALQTLEKLLRRDPLNMTILELYGRIADAANIPEVGILTLALAREHYPQNTSLLAQLGDLYMKTHQTRLGRECFETVCEMRPNDGAALKKLKDAMAIDSMAKDGWSDAAATGGDYRRVMKDEKEAVILEQEAKAVKGAADVDALIVDYLERIAKEPLNVNYPAGLANLYVSKRMYAEAMATLEEATQTGANRDPQVAAAISGIRLQQYDFEIDELQKAGDAAAVAAKQVERDKFAFRDLEDRVTRYPNDLQLRFDYGVMLYDRGQINDAIQQFQLAQRSPPHRVRALYYIGVCFASKKQYDMAIEQFEKAASELPGMDDQKKDIVYELGKALEAHGDHKKASDFFKQIYQVDITYQDVAARIEKGYPAAPSA